MSIDTVDSVCRELADNDLVAENVAILWHAGEPLTVPMHFYQQAFETILRRLKGRDVKFLVQTNGLLLNQRWLSFFARWNVEIGLSCDGPQEFHDRNRKTRAGNGTEQNVRAAARMLKEAGLRLSILCVITKASITYPDLIFQYFEELGADEVSFNVEESEGGNLFSTLLEVEAPQAKFTSFLRRYSELVLTTGSSQSVREVEAGLRHVFAPEIPIGNMELQPIQILTVAHDGGVGTNSPELLGVRHPELGSLVYENVTTPGWLPRLLVNERFLHVQASIQRGVEICRSQCEYFSVCEGGSPSNKLAENKTFESSTTLACGFYTKAVADAIVELVGDRMLPHRS